ncbi:MAG: hypothetical protein ACFCUX_03455 [Candidatus Methylacidiphilales bacterium]
MINKPESSRAPKKNPDKTLPEASRSDQINPKMRHYYEQRVRKTLRLNVVALRISGLLKD